MANYSPERYSKNIFYTRIIRNNTRWWNLIIQRWRQKYKKRCKSKLFLFFFISISHIYIHYWWHSSNNKVTRLMINITMLSCHCLIWTGSHFIFYGSYFFLFFHVLFSYFLFSYVLFLFLLFCQSYIHKAILFQKTWFLL